MPGASLLYLAALLCAALVLAACYLAFRLTHREVPKDLLARPAVRLRLEPMQRLLREADFVFLAYHPGYSPEIGRQLRRRRVKILRKYLDQLAAEFERLHLSLRLLTLHAAYDRPEIVRELLLQRLVFTRCLFEVRLRLALFGFGLKPVHAGTLVESLHRMQSQVELLSRSLQANQARTWSVSS